ncbi:MAG: AAA family ATPase [Pseudomonadota bacterium]
MTQIETALGARFGVIANSFCPLPDAGVIHWSRGHTRAAAALEFGLVSGAPFSILTGPAGCGKTALLLHLMENVEDQFRVAKADAGVEDIGIFAWLLQALGVPLPDPKAPSAPLAALQTTMIGDYAQGRSTFILIDEAHNLSDVDLHNLCLLSNINTARDRLLQIVLCGHAELRNRLTAPAFDDLAQRVGIWASVEPLNAEGTADYVIDHLRASGAATDLFTADALALIYQITAGVPRQINKLCELSLIFAAADRSEKIAADAVQSVLSEGFFLPPTTASMSRGKPQARLAVAVGDRP